MNDLLQETLNLIRSQKKLDNIDYRLDLDDSIPPVEIDPEQVKQVMVNLIMNAIEAMDGKGWIRISSRYDNNTDKVSFSVADNGPGIPEENLKKLFTPFFTTKQIGKGTGLGLAICYGIIKMHRGDVRVNTKVGEGAEFVVTLPRLHNVGHKDQILGSPANGSRLAVAYQPRRFSRFNKQSVEEK